MRGACRLATTGAQTGTYANGALGVGATFTFTATGSQSVDGSATALNDRIAMIAQASALQNGIYTVTTKGAGGTSEVWTRATDYDQAAEIVEGSAMLIDEGATLAGRLYIMTTSGAITVGTTGLTFTASSAATAAALSTARAIDGVAFNGTADITVIAPATHAATAKTAFVAADEFSMWDSVSGLLRKITGANIIASVLASILATVNSWTKAQIGAPVALSVASNLVAVDLSLGNNFTLTLQATTAQTLSNPTNVTPCQKGSIYITQNGTPSTLAFGNQWIEAATGTAPAVSTTAGGQNILVYDVFDATHIYYSILKHGVA
jgi:hypothetical protein